MYVKTCIIDEYVDPCRVHLSDPHTQVLHSRSLWQVCLDVVHINTVFSRNIIIKYYSVNIFWIAIELILCVYIDNKIIHVHTFSCPLLPLVWGPPLSNHATQYHSLWLPANVQYPGLYLKQSYVHLYPKYIIWYLQLQSNLMEIPPMNRDHSWSPTMWIVHTLSMIIYAYIPLLNICGEDIWVLIFFFPNYFLLTYL